MRVLVTNHFPFHGSGTGTYVLELGQGLTSAGHVVEGLIVDGGDGANDPFPVERIVCRSGDRAADLPFDFPCFTSHPRSRQTFGQLSDGAIAQYREAIRRRLDNLIVRFDPHIIHCQHIWLMGQLALESGAPYVLSAQGTDLMGYRDDQRYRRLADQAAENAGRIIAASQYIRQAVLETFDVAAENVVTVYGAIDPRPFMQEIGARETVLTNFGLPRDSGPIVAYAGKLVPFKGVDTLLNAAAIYEIDPLNIVTVIAGDGAQRAELESQTRRLGLRRTWFVGDLPRERCGKLFGLADLVVVPSRGEPFGFAALEAMASGTPVIGTRAGGLSEILSDAVGGLVPPDDHEMLAMKILEGLDQTWKATKGPASRQYVIEHHGPRAWIERIVAIYRQVLNERFGGSGWESR